MKRLACILTLFISVCVYGNTHILKNSSDPQSNASSQKERQHNTTDCWISHENELWGVHQYEKDSLNFILYFYDYTGQIQFAVKDIAQGRYLNLEVIVPVFMKADINKNPVCASLMKTL